MMTPAKREVTVTLDADLIESVEADTSTTLSAVLNSALRVELETRRRRQGPGQLDPEHDPLNTAEEKSDISRYLTMLGGPANHIPVEELLRRKNVRPIKSIEELACPGLFESDDELDEFLTFVRASRRADYSS